MKKTITAAMAAMVLTVGAQAEIVGVNAGIYNGKAAAGLNLHKKISENIDATVTFVTNYNGKANVNYKIDKYTKLGLGLQADNIDYTYTITTTGLDDITTVINVDKTLSTVNAFVKITLMPTDFADVYVKASKDFVTGGASVVLANFRDYTVTTNVEYTNRYNAELKDTNMQNYVNANIAVNYKF